MTRKPRLPERFYLPVAAFFLLLIPFGLYFFFYVGHQEEYYKRRNVRDLGVIADQVRSRVETCREVLQKRANYVASWGTWDWQVDEKYEEYSCVAAGDPGMESCLHGSAASRCKRRTRCDIATGSEPGRGAVPEVFDAETGKLACAVAGAGARARAEQDTESSHAQRARRSPAPAGACRPASPPGLRPRPSSSLSL